MVELGPERSDSTLEMSDSALECSRVPRAVQGVLNDDIELHRLRYNILAGLVRFLQKYAMARELKLIRSLLFDHTIPWPGYSAFLLASWLGDHEVCRMILMRYGLQKWNGVTDVSNEEETFGQRLHRGRVFDLRTWSAEMLELLPEGIAWALLRACPDINLSETPNSEGIDRLADEFLRLIRLRK